MQRAKKNAFKKGQRDKREDVSRNNSEEESNVIQTYLEKGMDDAKDCLKVAVFLSVYSQWCETYQMIEI